MDPIIINILWKNVKVGWSSTNVVGMSGGILTLWNMDLVGSIFSFKGDDFLGVKIRWKNNLYYIVKVYSSSTLYLKWIMCGEILDLRKKLVDGLWVIGETLILF